MKRVHVLCEGLTEQLFVQSVLQDYFAQKNILLIPSQIGTPGHKGGNIKIERVLRDLKIRLLGDQDAYCTTLIDYYGLSKKFPGKQESSTQKELLDKADWMTKCFKDYIEDKLGIEAQKRFIPFVQMHEFESLLFSLPQAFAESCDRKSVAHLIAIRNQFASPEHINDNPATAPSKRIKQHCPRFQKTKDGPRIANNIGLESIRRECKHFDRWLKRLENLSEKGAK